MMTRFDLFGLGTAKALAILASCMLFSNWSHAQDDVNRELSFATDVRPVLAANCFGCHQGAIDRGGYVMTEFDSLVAGGESGDPAIVPGKPDESRLIDLVTSHDGEAEMPPNADPILATEVETIAKWIKQGAKNDYTKSGPKYSNENKPTYSRNPVLTSVDYSPDGQLLAVSGFHEVLLLESPKPDSLKPNSNIQGRIVKRLVGISSRIESVKFSPDGKRLAVSGGNPGEFGEVQVWDVETGELQLSKTVTYDSVYGVNWSPDGKMISFGCTDTTLRTIDSETGEQLLFQGAHDDWIRDTVFSVDGSKLVSVGRDMSCKLIDVPTQRFIDNITSITPGVLKGGISAVDRHPTRDEVVIGGADGIPKVYRMERLTKRVIGDDANLIRRFPKMPGRIQSVSVSKDGKRIVAASSLDGAGHIAVYSFDFNTKQPDNIKAIVSKVVTQQSKEEKKTLAEFVRKDAKQLGTSKHEDGGLYTTAFHPSGKWFVYGGTDGLVHFADTETCKPIGSVQPIELSKPDNSKAEVASWQFKVKKAPGKTDFKLTDAKLSELIVSPTEIKFESPTEYAQFVVQARYDNGSTFDVTESAVFESRSDVISLNGGFAQALRSGQDNLSISFEGMKKEVSVEVGSLADFVPDFVHDVNPVLSKLGCNAGTCHGSQGGKKGFKLSLRGYDPLYDIRAFTDDMASRRSNLTSPTASLMLLKPTGAVPHEGGKLISKGDKYYSLIHQWIAAGAKLDLNTPKVVSLKLFPENPVLDDAGARQQMRVVATYADGVTKDVTREAVVEIGDMEIGSVNGSVVTASRRGESPVIGRYEGSFTATTLTVMGRRDEFVWDEPESWGTIDDLVAAKWKRMKIQPSGLCDDAEFIRRVYLDLTGLPPSANQVEEFLADKRPTREKRDEVIDALIGNDGYVEHWANKWADLMQVNRKYLGTQGSKGLRDWIRGQVKSNRPYNEFAYDILTASGSNKENPAAAYYKIHRTPEEAMENTTHLFLATRFNCNKCHDHPFERWTQDQYYEMAAFFAQVDRKKDPASGDMRIGGTAVEGAKPLYEIIADKAKGEMTHERTGQVAKPEFPFVCNFESKEKSSRREELASWITSLDNPYFATSYVNRLWGYMHGVGLIEPLDDIRAGNPPSNPELLEYLRKEFVDAGFDSRHLIRLICKSRAYQLSVETNLFNADDQLNYSHAKARRLPAEVLFDSIHFVTGSKLKIPGVAPGTRAAALPDSGVKLPSGFLSTLGRPARESACECERGSDLQLGSVLALVSGPDLSRAINDKENEIARLVKETKDDRKLVDRLFLRILNRNASQQEIDLALETLGEINVDHEALVKGREARAKVVAVERPELEKERLSLIEESKAEVDAAIKAHFPDLLEKERVRNAQIAKATKNVDDYKSNIDSQVESWKRQQLNEIHWHPVLVEKVQSNKKRTFTVRNDRSVLMSSDPKGRDVYTVFTSTDLTGVSAVRLEVLSDEKLPNKGPGFANGNFVLTEFVMEVAHPDRPTEWQPVPFSSATSHFDQVNYTINKAIDGEKKGNQGWAQAGGLSKTNWATFQLKLPVGYSNGTLVRFKMHQTYDATHQIGAFRISLTKFHKPTGLSLSEELLAKLAAPAANWSEAQRTEFAKLAERGDLKLAELNAALTKASVPLVIPAQIVAAREKLARAERPVPPDFELSQLEKDIQMSEKQLENKRLTAAHDISWALINSPSFLFNR